MEGENNFFIFFFGWGLINLTGFLFFKFYKNIYVKKIVFPIFVIFTGIVFAYFTWSLMGYRSDPFLLFVFFPMIALISFLNIKNTRFCLNCGNIAYSQNWLKRITECPKCNKPL